MRIALVSFLCGLSVLGCMQQPEPRAAHTSLATVRLVYTWALDSAAEERLRMVLVRSLGPMRLELSRFSSERAIAMLQRDEADAALTYANVAYASLGQLHEATESTDRIRAIAELPIRAVQLAVGRHSGIKSVKELRGRHVSLGGRGGSGPPTAELVLRTFGITLDDVKAEQLEAAPAASKLIAGDLDAVFSFGYPNYMAEAIHLGARLIDIVGPEIDEFRTTYPLLKPTVIPAGTYPEIKEAIHTVGVDGIFICRTNLDQDVVYELTRALLEAVTADDLGIETLKHMNLSAASSTAIPLHPGAARYYRERELRP